MPTRISAGVGDHLVPLLFITMIPIDCKLQIFLILALESLKSSNTEENFSKTPYSKATQLKVVKLKVGVKK